MPLTLKFTLVAVALLLGACRSDPIHYHTLSPAQPTGQSRAGVDIQIEQVSVPPQVDRTQMVIRQGNSGLAILETEWWGASLSDELHSSLDEQLSNPGAPKSSLRVDVQRFDSIPGRYARMDAQWRLRNLGSDARPSPVAAACRHRRGPASTNWWRRISKTSGNLSTWLSRRLYARRVLDL